MESSPHLKSEQPISVEEQAILEHNQAMQIIDERFTESSNRRFGQYVRLVAESAERARREREERLDSTE